MFAISQLGRKYGLSRSTLLYYDRLKLIRPTYRTAAGYRLYSLEDEVRLKQVCRYRKAGLPLAEIARLLEEDDQPTRRLAMALQRRLTTLNHEIAVLRRQQQVVLELLPARRGLSERRARTMTKAKWVSLLRATGLDDGEMRLWHVAFERQSPLAHQDFLESLGLANDEIRRIRRRAAQTADAGSQPERKAEAEVPASRKKRS